MAAPSEPWPPHPDLGNGPSTGPRTHRAAAGSLLDRSRGELSTMSEAELGGHRSCINSADILCGYLIRGHPTPDRQIAGVWVKINEFVLGILGSCGLTPAITSMKAWALPPKSCMTISISSRSENIFVIRARRSSAVGLSLISCLHRGCLLYARKWSIDECMIARNKRDADIVRRTCETSEASGRKWGW